MVSKDTGLISEICVCYLTIKKKIRLHASSKESVSNVRDPGLIPGSEAFLEEGEW